MDFYQNLFTLGHKKRLSRRDVAMASWLIAAISCAIPPIFVGAFSGFLVLALLAAVVFTIGFFGRDFLVFFAAEKIAKIRNMFLDYSSRQRCRTFSAEDTVRLSFETQTEFKVSRNSVFTRPEKTDFSILLGAVLRALGLAPSFPRLNP